MRKIATLLFLVFLAKNLSAQCPAVFNFDTVYCQNEIPQALPNTVPGTWFPSTISTNTVGTSAYTFTPDTSTACFTPTVVNVTVHGNPTPSITGNDIICAGNNTTFTASGGTSYLWSTGATSSSINVNTAQTYIVTVTNANGCTATASRLLTVNANPTASPNFSQNPICLGGSTTLSANATAGSGTISTYSWPSGISGNNASGTVSTANIYTVTVTNSNGCTVAASSSILNVNPLPNASISGNNSICAGNNTTFTANGGTFYVWSTGATSSSINVNTAQTYTVTVTNANGCTATTSRTLTVNANPTASPAFAQNPICSDSTTILSANAFAGSGTISSYLWSSGISGNNASGAVASAGTYRVIVTNTNNCSVTATTSSLVVNPTPSIAPIGDQVLCAGTATTPVNFWSAVAGATFSWSNSNINIGLGGNGTGNFNAFTGIANGPNPNTGNIIVTSTANACNARDTFSITVNPLPIVDAGNNTSVCSGQPVVLSATGANAYNWTSNVINGQTFYPQVTNVYQVTGYNQFNQYSCSATDFVTVTVNPSPVLNIGPDLEICSGELVSVNAQNSSAVWSGLSSSTGSNISFNPTNSGFLYCQLSNANCTVRDSIFITVRPRPTVNAGNDQNICSGNPVTLSATGALNYIWSSGINNNQAFFPSSSNTYTVTGYNQYNCSATDQVTVNVTSTPVLNIGSDLEICNGDLVSVNAQNSNAIWSGLSSNSGSNISFSPTNAGFLYCQLSNGNCTARDSIYITVRPTPVVNAGNDQTICSGESVTLSATGALNYIWTSGVNNNQAFFPSDTNTYTVIGYNQYNCTATDQVTVNVITNPLLTLGQNRTICYGDSISISSQNSITVWSGITTSTVQNLRFAPLTSGYLVCQVSNNSCVVKDSIYVLVNPIPDPVISGPQNVCKNSYWQKYEVSPTTNGLSWSISNGEIQAGFGTNEIYVHWFNGSVGTLTVSEYIWSSGCSSEDELTVALADTALEPAVIGLLYNGGNVLHTTIDYPFMSWGYESVQTHIPIYLGISTQYCQIQNFDPSNYNYWVEIGDGNGCITKSYYNAPSYPIAVNHTALENQIKIYPNPVNEQLFVEIDNQVSSRVSYQIMDISGRIIKVGEMEKGLNTISVQELPNAVYFIYLQTDMDKKALKFVKN
jgi:hypothetical protein